MAVWFSASAVVPPLASQWHLSAGGAAWLTAPVQAGFVLGAVVSAVLGLADRIRPHLLAAGCAASAAACTLAMALFAGGPPRRTSTCSPGSAGTATPCTTTPTRRRRHGSARSSSKAG